MLSLLFLPLVGCAGNPQAADPGDPYEATNREILDFNLRVDEAVIKPVAVAYRDGVGPWTRTRIRLALDNLNEPVIAANLLLQGRPAAAGTSAMRFVVNSTLGLGGTFDMAQFGGPPRQSADFGQTLYVWGLGDGPYLMLPIAGPSTLRDSVGLAGDAAANPVGWALPFAANVGRGTLSGLDLRAENIETLDELRGGSLDFYARLRSVWRQRRDAELGRSNAESGAGLTVLDDPGAPPPRR